MADGAFMPENRYEERTELIPKMLTCYIAITIAQLGKQAQEKVFSDLGR